MNKQVLYRRLLLTYPTLYTCPLDVSIGVFSNIGAGYYWNGRGSVDCVYPIPDKPQLPDLVTVKNKVIQSENRIQHAALMTQYEFVKSNIKEIAAGRSILTLNGVDDRVGHTITSEIDPSCVAFTFPKNIRKQWADALADYFMWWKENLSIAWGLQLGFFDDPKKIERMKFPSKADKASFKLICEAEDRLFLYRHGETLTARKASIRSEIDADLEDIRSKKKK